MTHMKKKLLAGTTLFALALGISAYARRTATGSVQNKVLTLKVTKQLPASFEATLNGGKVVSMKAIYADGTRITLKQQSKPARNMTCPAGTHQACWEDQELQMSLCDCVPSGGSGGGFGGSAVVSLGKLGRVE